MPAPIARPIPALATVERAFNPKDFKDKEVLNFFPNTPVHKSEI